MEIFDFQFQSIKKFPLQQFKLIHTNKMPIVLTERIQQFSDVLNTALATIDKTTYEIEPALEKALDVLRINRAQGGHLYIIGNGGSAGVAAHAVTDFVNVAKLRASTLHDSSLLTCMSNDYGYDNAFKRILETMLKPQDVLIAISSSGKSPNIVKAAQYVHSVGGAVITFSGFDSENPLYQSGHINFWLNSHDYGFIELGHAFLLHYVADRLRLERQEENV